MTCVDQPLIRRAPLRTGFFTAATAALFGALRRASPWRFDRVEDLSEQMLRDVGLDDGRMTEKRMRRGMMRGQPFDQLRF